MNKFEELIEMIINDEQDKARDLFHDVVVEKSREIYEELMAEETPVEEATEEVAEEATEEEVAEPEDEPFSFFVTSLEAMQLLSGSVDGFGGDLGGLAGADEICQTIAATVDGGHKTWRAFLSATSGPDGLPVHASERGLRDRAERAARAAEREDAPRRTSQRRLSRRDNL